MGGEWDFSSALEAALAGAPADEATEEMAAPMAYKLPFLQTGYLGEQLLYELHPHTRTLRIAATEKTIDELLREARGKERFQVRLYAMEGADGAEFENVASIEPLPGEPVYARDQLELLPDYDRPN